MTDRDVMTLLAKANPVRVEDLSPLDQPDLARPRHPHRRLVVAAATAVVAAGAAATIGVFAFNGSPSQPPRSGHGPSVAAHPVPPQPIPFADASAALGAPLIVPHTSLISQSDVGSVTKVCAQDSGCEVSVEFPAQDVTIRYGRYGPPFPDPLPGYEVEIADDTVPVELVYLGSVPAVLNPKGPESPGSGSTIAFQVGETTISIFARDYDGVTVTALAQSIVDQYTDTTLPAGHARLADAAAILGAPVVLPSTSLVSPSDAASEVSTACPTDGAPDCELTVDFPSTSLTVRYLRGGHDLQSADAALKTYRAIVRKSQLGAQVVDVNGTPALFVPEQPGRPGWLQFVVGDGNVNVFVQGQYDEATLQSVAQSILDHSGS